MSAKREKEQTNPETLIGEKFGKLTIEQLAGKNNRGYLVECLCECGNRRVFAIKDLRSGNNKSCGCLAYKHGKTRTRIYRAWSNMKKRCNNEQHKDYRNYGGRGIKYCEKWETFDGFYDDMGEEYADNLTIDRIDVNGDYTKANCRWITVKEQGNNKRNTRYFEYKGEILTLTDIADKYGVKYKLMKDRINTLGWSIEQAVEEPKVVKETITFNGVTKEIGEFAKERGMTYHQLKKRLMRGWTIERALTQPLRKSPKRK